MSPLRPVLCALSILAGCLWAALCIDAQAVAILVPAVLGCGLCCGVAAAGWRAPLLAWRAATAPPERVPPRQVLALHHLARGTLVAGLTIGMVAVLVLFAQFRDPGSSPARIADLARWSLLAPLAGVYVGRVCCGSLVDALGATQLAADRSTLFAAVAIAVVAFVTLTLPY